MDDDRRPLHVDEDVDPDAISVWDHPLGPPAAERTGLPATEIAAAARPGDDDGEVTPTSWLEALAATEEWIDHEPRDGTERMALPEHESVESESAPPSAAGPPPPPVATDPSPTLSIGPPAPQRPAAPAPQHQPASFDTQAAGIPWAAAPPPLPEATLPPPPPPTSAPSRRAIRRGSWKLTAFGVVFGLALVVIGALLTTVGAPPGGDPSGVLLLGFASVVVAGALIGGGVVAMMLLRRPSAPRRRVRPRPEALAAPPPPSAPSQILPRPVPSQVRPRAPAPDEPPSPLPSELACAPLQTPSPFERFVPPRPGDGLVGAEWDAGDTIVGRYRVARKITSGMGVVYLCHDSLQQQPVAIKTYRDLGETVHGSGGGQRDVLLARLFEAEALIWIRLGSHPNIVEAQYVAELHGKPHLFLELVGGPDGREHTLRRLVKAGPHEAVRVLRLGLHVCAGMEHATSVFPGLVHRDLKPENLLVAADDIVKVTDFGLTRVFADVSGRVAALAGTPAYMSPEQCLGLSSLDTHADIYALGVILYELAAGRRPFTSDFLRAHLTEAPVDPRQHAPDMPDELAAIVLRCLAKRPEDRYQTFTELRAALSACYLALTGQPPKLPTASGRQRTEHEQASIDLARAISLATLGRHDEAVELLNRAVLLDPGYAEAWRWRGIGLTALGQLAEAAACFDQAVTLAPRDIDAWLEKGRLDTRRGRREDAVRSFNAALAVNAEHVAARYERGAALFFLGRYAEASTDLIWANAQQPGPALQAAVDAASRRATTDRTMSDDSALDGLSVLISESPVHQSAPGGHA